MRDRPLLGWPFFHILIDGYRCLATYAIKNQVAHMHLASALEKRFLVLGKAIWTKPMRWFSAALKDDDKKEAAN